jgi:photosystem II stability/assembly factor-like uncharacterized protein
MPARLSLSISVLVGVFVAVAPLSSAQRGGRVAAAPTINVTADPLLHSFIWRSIGPVSQGGRVDDIAVADRDPRTFYLAYATGGVWKTSNAGTTFEPVFDTYGTGSVGAVAVAPSNPDVVWVGTGESDGRNNSAFGNGVYKSNDGGRTFSLMGLGDSQTIERIAIDPHNPDVVYVAVPGHLHGPNPDRGLYKTADGGKTWHLVLAVDENTGAGEIVLDPSNSAVVYATTYQRRRTAFGFNGGGPGSGIWKSEDAGAHWSRLSGHGLPGGPEGRIGLAVSLSNPNVVYAQIEVLRDEDRVPDASAATTATAAEKGTDNAGGVWRSADKGASWQFQSAHDVRPQYFSTIRVDPTNENVLYSCGRSFYRSEDAGKTFRVVSGAGHSDYHAIWINPHQADEIIVGNDGNADVTYDRGRTWQSFRAQPVGQFAGLAVDMQQPYDIYGGLQDNGSLAGPSQVRYDYITAADWFTVGGGDGADVAVDPTGHRSVYSEAQRGTSERLDLLGGRSVPIQAHPPTAQNPSTNIVPAPPVTEVLRWNWAAPFVMSHEDPNVLYAGANRLLSSTDRGATWTMSPDLTKHIDPNTRFIMGVPYSAPYCHGTGAQIARGQTCVLSKSDGTWFYSTLVTIAESTLPQGPLWVGADDGTIEVSRDRKTWTNVTPNLHGAPAECYVARIEASHFDASTAYVALNCGRNDDLRPYAYVTRNQGQTWTSIVGDLPPTDSLWTIRQDLKNRTLLFAGTEFGFFVSFDEGQSWTRFMTGLPYTRMDEVIVHPRDGDLVLGTYGRSVYVMDDITPLEQTTEAVRAEAVHLYAPRQGVLWDRDVRLAHELPGAQPFRAANPPFGTALCYYFKTAPQQSVTLTITDASGRVVRHLIGPAAAGINRVEWNLRTDPLPNGGPRPVVADGEEESGGRAALAQPPLVPPGTYRVTLTVNGQSYAQTVTVVKDPREGGAT